MNTITILPGYGKNRSPETFEALTLSPGELLSVVGNTGSGKSRLIKDIEQLVHQDSVTGRTVLLDGKPVLPADRLHVSDRLIAHLSQNMRFVLDVTVAEFLRLHCLCRGRNKISISSVIELANTITPEPIQAKDSLNLLSGGQSRALMIADIAKICDSPVVLIDEIENAGIDKKRAFELLLDAGKLVLNVTHDPHTALMAKRRVILEGGAVVCVRTRSEKEEHLFYELEKDYEKQITYQKMLRKGESLA